MPGRPATIVIFGATGDLTRRLLKTLLYDMMMGDQTLFQRADQIEAGWAVVQPILDAWARGEGVLEEYTPGTSGPRAADALIARDGRQWHALGR